MGSFLSGVSTDKSASTVYNNIESKSETMEDVKCLHDNGEHVPEEKFYDIESDDEEARARIREEEMNEFRKQLNVKREQRKEILARHKAEKKELENKLHVEQKSQIELCEKNRHLRELLIKNNIDIPSELEGDNEKLYIVDSISHMGQEIEKLKSTNISLRCDLAKSNSALQAAYSDLAEMSAQNSAAIKQVHALKEVITVSKTMISLREEQLNELKTKLNEIEQSLADRETNMLSTDLRQEYERQLQNIRTLRSLYEERARLADVSRQALTRELNEHKVLLEVEINKNKDITARVNELEAKVDVLEDTVEDKNNLISTCQKETRGIKAEMSVVNKLFSQVLLGYKNKQDLDKLIHRLEENHGILTQMAEKENGSEVSSELPKLLLEIVSQIEESNTTCETTDCEVKSDTQNTTAEEIVENLPKVWRVLIELLSHQRETEAHTSNKVTTCYKSVETKSGPVLVPSVSQTYIRLKDLILEKLTLIKEVNRMKQLNTHLESRLEEQERRLCNVTNELSKTWNVVGRLRRHHHQLHTHEKILKYELQQKRKLLNELKEELEYCREKWEQAREKNSQSEKDWKKLRIEFSNRKLKPELTSINNSAESGYSDERQSDESSESNDESEYVELKVKCKKKFKKSFETNSSADYNLAAEREDPASDMLDVADLPLDTQEDNHECDVNDSNSESLFKNEKLHEETEDEVADMTVDSCLEECSVTHRSPDCSLSHRNMDLCTENILDTESSQENSSIVSETSALNTNVEIDPATIISNIKEQTERLIQKDKRLEKLENDGAHLLRKTQNIAKFSEQINSTLDNILTRPTSSVQVVNENRNIELQPNSESTNSSEECSDVNVTETLEFKINPGHQLPHSNNNHNKQEDKSTIKIPSSSVSVSENNTDYNNVSFVAILESDPQQKECLQSTDENLENIEQGYSEKAEFISNGLNSSPVKTDEQDMLNACNDKEINQLQSPNVNKNDLESENKTKASLDEPSTSREIDHEARFAARDLRLKRLEEQTKSLVNKVNKTTTKGVKIHYKLEELHNIYGSENSRSGTPSEDAEDTSQNDDDMPSE